MGLLVTFIFLGLIKNGGVQHCMFISLIVLPYHFLVCVEIEQNILLLSCVRMLVLPFFL